MFTKFKLYLVNEAKNDCRLLTGELKAGSANIFEWQNWESGEELMRTIEFLTDKQDNEIAWSIKDNMLSLIVMED